MILILIPVAAIFLGLGLWAAMRGLGALNVLGSDGRGSFGYERQRANSVGEWFRMIRSGWLLAVIGVCGVWILAWLVVLLVGLSYLS